MPRNSRKSMNDPNPLYALAGAGDLAVEKIREFSKIASERINSLETTDPAAVSDRVQERIEERADALAVALRSASSDLRIQAKDLSAKAQAAVQSVLIQAGDTYETLSERGKGAVVRIRSQQNGGSSRGGGRQLTRSNSSGRSSSGRSSSSRSTSSSSRSNSSTSRPKSTTTRKRSSTKSRGGSMAGTRKATRSATDAGSTKQSTTAKSDTVPTSQSTPATPAAPNTPVTQPPSAATQPATTPAKDTAAKKPGQTGSAT